MSTKLKEKVTPTVIAFSGKAGCGKDTCMEMLKRDLADRGHTVKLLSHAGALKRLLIHTLGFTGPQVYSQKGKKEVNEMWNMTGREALVRVGTELFRNHFHDNTWVILLNKQIKECGCEFVIIQDCRFDNEAENINAHSGYIIDIHRDPFYQTKRYKILASIFRNNQWLYHILYKLGLVSFRWHLSELLNPNTKCDDVIVLDNTGSLKTLRNKIKRISKDIRFHKEFGRFMNN